MGAHTRPYFVSYKSIRRLVEASSPASAAAHVVGPDIAELRAARASEVSQWYRDGHPVDVAGDDTKPLTGGLALEAAAEPFGPVEARGWVIASLGEAIEGDQDLAVEIFDDMRVKGYMVLEQFQRLNDIVPAFGPVIAGADRSVQDIERELAGGESIEFDQVVNAIANAALAPEASA